MFIRPFQVQIYKYITLVAVFVYLKYTCYKYLLKKMKYDWPSGDKNYLPLTGQYN